MRSHKFIFKFIDHNAKHCKKIAVCVKSNKIQEYMKNENESENMAWKQEHMKWEKAIKEEVSSYVNQTLFGGKGANFSDYVFMKKKESKKGEVVNVNPNSQPAIMRKVKWIEKTCMTFEKGHRPANCAEIFNYTKDESVFVFYLLSEINKSPIELKPLSSYTVPQDQMPQNLMSQKIQMPQMPQMNQMNQMQQMQMKQMQMPPQMKQMGGENQEYEKYLKYKNKYMKLRNGY